MAAVLRGVVTALVIGIILLVGLTITGTVADVAPNSDASHRADTVNLVGTSGYVEVVGKPGVGKHPDVVNSRGNAIQLSGANDSYIQSQQSVDVSSDETWTVATWAELNDSANLSSTMTVLSVDGRLILRYNGTNQNWSAYYYDDSTTGSDIVEVDAPDPTNMTHLAVTHDGTNLTLHRNNAGMNTAKTNDDSIATGDLEAQNLHGTLEETRTFDDVLSDSERQQLVDSPIKPLPDSNRTARIMFDQGSGTNEPIFYAGTTATLSNATWVDGFDGETMGRADVLGNGDYRWTEEGPELKAMDGGQLEHAPVAYVEHDFRGQVALATRDIAGAYNLASIIPILLIGGLVLTALRLKDV